MLLQTMFLTLLNQFPQLFHTISQPSQLADWLGQKTTSQSSWEKLTTTSSVENRPSGWLAMTAEEVKIDLL